jgi:hypothetical protein
MARTLCGFFRQREFVDAKLFASGLAATFQQYPEILGLIVVDPVNGLPATSTFPPSIHEVRKELETRRFWAEALNSATSRMLRDQAA